MTGQHLPVGRGTAILLAAGLTCCAAQDTSLPLGESAREEQRHTLLDTT